MQTYRARRRLQMRADVWREPEELLPEAHTWHRIDAYLHTGFVVEAEVGEQEFREAVARYCPELAERIFDLTGLDGALLTGARRTPRKRATTTAPSRPEVVRLKDD